jgi:hypothetical protein
LTHQPCYRNYYFWVRNKRPLQHHATCHQHVYGPSFVPFVAVVQWNLSEASDSSSLTSSGFIRMSRTDVPLVYLTSSHQKSPHGTIRHFLNTQPLITCKNNYVILITKRENLKEIWKRLSASNLQNSPYACAVFLHDSVANHQIPVPHSCLPAFAPPSNTSYHKRM